MASIVVIGSLNMDLSVLVDALPEKFATVAGSSFRTSPGGKGANQAVAAARLGAEVAMVGRVGADAYGSELVENLNGDGVDITNIIIDPATTTGTALITIDRTGANTIVVVPGANGNCSPEDVDRAEPIIASARVVVVQLEIPLTTVAHALQLAARHGVATVLNPAPVVSGMLSEAMLSLVDYIVPNEIEAAAILGISKVTPENASMAAMNLTSLGPKNAVITLGAHGAVCYGPCGLTKVPAYEVTAVDSTAAGDAFIAAFAVGLTENMGLGDALSFASATGALAVTKMGAQTSLPTRQEVEALMS